MSSVIVRKVGSEKWGAGPKPPVWLHGELGEGDAVAFVNTAGSGNGLFPFSLIFNLSFFLQIFFVLQSDKPLAQCGLGHCFQRYTVLLYACVLTCANLVTIMTHDSRSQLFAKGTFLVERQEGGTYGLTVIQNGKPTPYSVSRSEKVSTRGTWRVGDNPAGVSSNLADAIDFLTDRERCKMAPPWPAPLLHPVARSSPKPKVKCMECDKLVKRDEGKVDTHDNNHFYCFECWKELEEETPASATPLVAVPAAKPAPATPLAAVPAAKPAPAQSVPKWLHGTISEEDAKMLVCKTSEADGTFLLR